MAAGGLRTSIKRTLDPRRQLAGETLGTLLVQRQEGLMKSRLMCDGSTHRLPKGESGAEIVISTCLAHARRFFVDIAASFPEQCRQGLDRAFGLTRARNHRIMRARIGLVRL